ncbi:MAG: 2-C-methyl-D-erythritol 4-phosphate cytidylyltransferase [Lachnospiraceae bacterium]|nr:2-C-methyl-D-erythritol 4-phosphate cytidylyltransferase [Lachnospiraceae bacterium]
MAYAIVLAAGVGSRMNSTTPKQFLKLKDKEVVCYSLDIFQEDEHIEYIILVTGEEHIEYCQKNIVDKYAYTKVRAVVAGGAERYNSVYNGLKAVESLRLEDDLMSNAGRKGDTGDDAGADKEAIVVIHDGARPFITHFMIQASIEKIKSGFSGCTVAVPAKDTIKIVEEKNGDIVGVNTPDRNTLYHIQTPQTFDMYKLKEAYERMLEAENHKITDDTMLLELYMGEQCAIVPGSYENIKLTTPEDMIIGERFVQNV